MGATLPLRTWRATPTWPVSLEMAGMWRLPLSGGGGSMHAASGMFLPLQGGGATLAGGNAVAIRWGSPSTRTMHSKVEP